MVLMSFGADRETAGGTPIIGARMKLIGHLTATGFAGFMGLILLTTGVVLGLEWGLGGVWGR